MVKKLQSVMRMNVHYYDESKTPDLAVCGQWEYLQAQRKYKKSLSEAGETGDLEYMSFVAFRASARQGFVPTNTTFEDWMATVMAIEPEGDGAEGEVAGESQAPPAA